MSPGCEALDMADPRMQSTRFFRSDAVPAPVINEVLEEARWCGSARNRQPWTIFVVTSLSTRQALATLAPHGSHLATAPVAVVLGLDLDKGGLDAQLDGGRLLQTILRSCQDRGLGSCPVTFFPSHSAEAASRIVGAQAQLSTRTAIAIGYRDAGPTGESAIPVGRRPLTDIVKWL